jgi:hypothetical protein
MTESTDNNKLAPVIAALEELTPRQLIIVQKVIEAMQEAAPRRRRKAKPKVAAAA